MYGNDKKCKVSCNGTSYHVSCNGTIMSNGDWWYDQPGHSLRAPGCCLPCPNPPGGEDYGDAGNEDHSDAMDNNDSRR